LYRSAGSELGANVTGRMGFAGVAALPAAFEPLRQLG
jgi:hypothetical protein